MKEPKCKKCGHSPCPCCETWCDVLLRMCTCPKCAGAFDLEDLAKGTDDLADDDYTGGLPQDGDRLACPLCKHSFNLDWTENVEVELCCDSECEYDLPVEKVQAWCHKELLEMEAEREAE